MALKRRSQGFSKINAGGHVSKTVLERIHGGDMHTEEKCTLRLVYTDGYTRMNMRNIHSRDMHTEENSHEGTYTRRKKRKKR